MVSSLKACKKCRRIPYHDRQVYTINGEMVVQYTLYCGCSRLKGQMYTLPKDEDSYPAYAVLIHRWNEKN
jgi:hypothetical protein